MEDGFKLGGDEMLLTWGGDAVIYYTAPPTAPPALPGRAINSPDVLLTPE